jgi:ATP-dependent Clp protease ATP-binding subunit ClpC
MEEVKRVLSPEFINRIDEIIIFDPLTEEQLHTITRLMIERLNQNLTERGLSVTLSDEVYDWLVETTCKDRSYGARPLRRAIQKHIEDALSEGMIRGEVSRQGTIWVVLDNGQIAFRGAREPNPTR